jgi:membrane protease YdiL (CAAX protease family)
MVSADPTPEPTEDAAATQPTSSESVPSELTENSVDSVIAAASKSKVVLPQPNLLVAAVLTTVPVVAQLVVVGALIIAVLLFLIVSGRPDEFVRLGDKLQLFLLPASAIATLLVAITACRLFFGQTMARKLAWRGFSIGQLICVLALTVPLAVLASEVTNCANDLLQQFQVDWMRKFHEQTAEVFFDFVTQPWWFVFVSACLLPGLGEEIYCRGLLSHGLVARYGVVRGTLLAAGMFGAMHIEPVQALGAFSLGILLQFVFLTTRSIAAPIVLHTLHNGFASLTMRFAESYPVPGLTPMPDGNISHTPIAVLAAAAIAVSALVAIMFQIRTRWKLPDGSEWSPGYVTAEIPDASIGAIAVREAAKPLLVCGAAIALGLFLATLISAHLVVVAN